MEEGEASGTSWRGGEDLEDRRRIFCEMFHMIPTKGWHHKKLPAFLQSLEEILYLAAQSKEEYADMSTLQERMRVGARLIVKERCARRRADMKNNKVRADDHDVCTRASPPPL